MNKVVRLAWASLFVIALAAFGGSRSRVSSTTPAPVASDVEAASADEDGDDNDDDVTADDDTDDPTEVDDDAPVDVDELAAGIDAGRRRRPHRGGCPGSMVRVRDFCIDRYEAPNRRGAKPLVMQSANDAVEWCSTRNKRLCTEDEWIQTCEGEEHRAYPYGDTHEDGRCNDDKPWRKVDEATLAKWPAPEAHAHSKELYQATPSGWKRKCVSEDGARDLTGNVEEWVSRTRDHDNDWPYILIGCYWSGCYGGGKPTCRSTNDAHGPEFRFYETGFRCCRDAAKPKK